MAQKPAAHAVSRYYYPTARNGANVRFGIHPEALVGYPTHERPLWLKRNVPGDIVQKGREDFND